MSEKLDTLFKALQEGHMISLYKNRVMFDKSGSGEIQFWNLKDGANEGELVLYNDGVSITFTKYEIVKNDNDNFIALTLFNNDTKVADMNFPKYNRIIQNHNTFYVEEFTLYMENVLNDCVASKGDWANNTRIRDLADGVRKNLNNVKANADPKVVSKSCIDIANYAMMLYYLYGQEK